MFFSWVMNSFVFILSCLFFFIWWVISLASLMALLVVAI
jgi:hypothetical protein